MFEPWALWTDKTVNEPIPVRRSRPAATSPVRSTDAERAARQLRREPKVLARGQLISHEHETTGRVVDPGACRQVAGACGCEDLDTSNGPDVEVWITDAPVIDGSDGWHVFDDGDYVELGDLKGNHGNQNYRSRHRSISMS